MGFFGEIIDEDGMEIPIPDGYHLKLLQACFNPNGKGETKAKETSQQGPLVLTVTAGEDDRELVLCVVNPDSRLYQAQLGHTFSSEDGPVIFQVQGGELHVTGVWSWDEESDEFCDSDEEEENEGFNELGDQSTEEEEEEEEEEPPQLISIAEERKLKMKKETTEKEESKKKRSSSDVNIDQSSMGEVNGDKKKKSKSGQAEESGSKSGASGTNAVMPKDNDKSKGLKKWKVHVENSEGVLVPDPEPNIKAGGAVITDYIIGNGVEPKLGSAVKILYEGYFPNGTLFDAKLKKKEPFVFRKGTGQVIRGMDIGLEGMRIGGAREIYVPYTMGYGLKGAGDDIPGKQDLIFRIRLLP